MRYLFLCLLLCGISFAATPTFVQRNADPNTGTLGTINNTNKNFANGTKAGNSVLVFGVTDNDPIGNVSVSDDKSDSYGSPITSLRDPSGSFLQGANFPTIFAFVSANVAAGAKLVTITQSTGGNHDTQLQYEYDNLSATADGTCSATVTSGTSIACGSFTPTTSGDLICQYVHIETPSVTGTETYTEATTGTTLNIISSDATAYDVVQCGVQSVAAAINPTLTTSSAVTRAITIGFALKNTASGSTPTGLYLSAFDIMNTPEYSTVTTGTTLTFQSPCNGNFQAIQEQYWHGQQISSASDNNSNTWSQAGSSQGEAGGSTASLMGWWYTSNASPSFSSTQKVTLTLAAAPNGDGTNNRPTYRFYCFQNAGGWDSVAGAVGSFGNSAATSGTITWGSSITPSQNNSAIICGQQEANDTPTSVNSGTLLDINLNSGCTPGTDCINELDWSDKDGGDNIFYQGTAAAYTPAWTYTNTNFGTGIGDWWGQCIVVKPIVAAATCSNFIALMGAGCK